MGGAAAECNSGSKPFSSGKKVSFSLVPADAPAEEPTDGKHGTLHTIHEHSVLSGKAAGGQRFAAAAAASSDLEAAEGSRSSWLSRQLRWPHIPVYSDIGTGTWRELSWHILTATSTPVGWAALPFAMARLTWFAGIPVLLLLIACQFYSAYLTVGLNRYRVTMRFCRFRDMGRSIWGTKGFHGVFILQQLGALGGNLAVTLSASIVMKNLWISYHPDRNVSLHVWLLVWTSGQILLSQIPTMHHLRHLNALGTAMIVVCCGAVAWACIKEGAATRDTISYALPPATKQETVLGFFGALSIYCFSLASVLIPEMQATVKPPVVLNGQKGITFAYGFILVVYPLAAVTGYWAFGNAVSPVIMLQLNPTSWQAVLSQIILVVHAAFCYQLFARPAFEVIEYILIDYHTEQEINIMSPINCFARLCGTTVYVVALGFLASLLPNALGSIFTIIGAVCFIPLDLVLPMLAANAVQQVSPALRAAHIGASIIWMCIAVGAIASALYDLSHNAAGGDFFADVAVGGQT